jgi:cytochrome c oxidase subunit 2
MIDAGRIARSALGLALVALLGGAAATVAVAGIGQPSPQQLGLQEPATEVMSDIRWFHDALLMPIITAITIFVLLLLVIVMVKYNEKSNPKPSQNTHNTLLEVAWTLVPILILVVIAVPSFKLLYKQYEYPKADVVVKAVGNQWFWSYEYPDSGVSFDSYMLKDEEIAAARAKGIDAPRLLAVDNEVVVPVDAVVHVLLTARDVIHAWTIPSFGSKADAVPGRLTSTWFKATRKGVYYGQCSELCGKDHAFMPIAVRVVDRAVYDQWVGIWKAGAPDADSQARDLIQKAALEDAGQKVAAAAP